MAITDPLVLPPDVVLAPVVDLAEDVRRRLDSGAGDWAVTRPRARAASCLIDADAALLLEEFRAPSTIVDAVVRFSRARGADPEVVLTEAYPLLDRLLRSGFLVSVEEDDAGALLPSLSPGDEVAGFQVLECVQSLDDTELYQVRRGNWIAALKIERSARKAGDLFAREAAVLARLGDEAVTGDLDGRRWLAVAWHPGIDAATAAAELRRAGDRAGLLALCRAVLSAYVRLHESGVIHGDVHPRNLLVAADGGVRLIDFGSGPGRGGVGFYFEPEYARAVLEGRPASSASAAGEQYAVAVLLDFLLTGTHYRDFRLVRERMLRQIAEEPPLSFAERGVERWLEVEGVLARALEKDPAHRFASMADFAAALAAVEPPRAPLRRAEPSAAEALLERTLDRLDADGPLFRQALPVPRASVTFGAAGIACGLYRIALARENARLLSLADLWAVKAARETGDEAWLKEGTSLSPERIGRVSPWHAVSGVHAVRALLAHARADGQEQREAVSSFLQAVRSEPCPNPDLTLGRSGVLLTASLLLDTFGKEPVAGLPELGDEILAGLWDEIDRLPPIPDCFELSNLGMAHGWAGFLYAMLRWCRSAGRLLPAGIEARLAELADCARPWGRGLRWPWHGEGTDPRTASSMPGWCNGSAGFVFLWGLAHRTLGGPDFWQLAEGAAWNAWEAPDGGGTLCCGLAGRAYALLHLNRHGGGPEWLARARDLADRAARAVERDAEAPDSLYKGRIGVAVLAADLARPEGAAMPFFEEEGWGGGRSMSE
ncbi:MAG TPA: lanthionine synthetase LanC family protein [Thermoanaerobaculia bacterium]|nr:lanthionine synthetase LanC family protein [Thermoanaerobaculia bacterium]